jgi:Animal haem peroxidase
MRGTRLIVAACTTGVVLGAVAVVRVSGSVNESRPQDPVTTGGFGRMFRLPPFARPTPQVEAALAERGKRGGPMDASDDLSAGPVALIVDPALSLNNPNNDQHTPGVTFMGRFLDHDMTFDATSKLGQPTNPRRAPSARRVFIDLDSAYGDGPVASPLLYEPSDRAKFRIETGGRFEDLPRDASGTAIFADPRNDENIVIAGPHAAFLLFHNHAVDLVRREHPSWLSDAVFTEARRLTCFHTSG